MSTQILFATRTARRVNVAAPVGLLSPFSDFTKWKLHTQNGAAASRVADGNATKVTITTPAFNNSVQLRNEEGTAANGQQLKLRARMWASEPVGFQITSEGPAPNYMNLGLNVSANLTTTPTQFEFAFTVANYVPGADMNYYLPSFYLGNLPVGVSIWFEAVELLTA